MKVTFIGTAGIAIAGLASFATPVGAQGFALRDLTSVAPAAEAALGAGFAHRAEPARLTLHCPGCANAPMVGITLGRQDDGTEERVRSGQTTMAQLEQACQAREPSCTISALDVAPAVGWISTYAFGSAAKGSTAVIIRGGDLLTIRSLAEDEKLARSNAEKLVSTVGRAVIGR